MKSDMNEILLPTGSKVYKGESSTYVFIKTVMLCGMVFGACLAFYRYETKLDTMEAQVFELSLKVNELERHSIHDEETEDHSFTRNKRQISAKSQRLADTWVSRSADGEPELNYRDYSTEEGLVGSRQQQRRRQNRRRPTTTEEPLVRNNEDETFYSTRGGQRFQPSGLKEMYDRLPPMSSESNQQPRPAPASRTRSLPPIRKIGRGRNQVSARVISDDDEMKKEVSPVAAHFVADVSNFTNEDNPRLRNSDGVFQIWRPEEWNTKDALAYDRTDGTLTVLKPGIYYVYAQIHYHDENVEGFKLEVNDKPLLQCTSKQEFNSCFTAGLTKLNENDKIVVKNIGQNIFSIFKPEKSFFGLMRVSEM